MTQFNLFSLPNKLKIAAGSTALFLSMCVLTLFYAPVVIGCALFPFQFRYNVAKSWARLSLKFAEIFCGIRYRVEGLENIDPKRPAVILSNHQSAWETIAFRFILPTHTALFKESLLWIPLWGWALATLKPIAINRKNKHAALRKLMHNGTAALKEGLWILIFPEGTRKPVGQLGHFSAGGAMLGQKSGFPVIPVAHNAGLCWPRNSFLKYPGLIIVKIGPYIESAGKKTDEINRFAENWITQTLDAIKDSGKC